MANRTRKFLHGLGAGYLNQVIILLGGLWLTRFILFHFGAERYGVWLVLMQLFILLEILDFGVLALVPREIAYLNGKHEDPDEKRQAFHDYLNKVRRLTLYQLPLIALVVYGMALVFVQGYESGEVELPVLVVAASYVLLFPGKMYRAILQGLQDLAYVSLLLTICWLVQATLICVLILLGFDYWSFVIAFTINHWLNAFLCWFRVRKLYPDALPNQLLGTFSKTDLPYLRSGFWVTISRISTALFNGAELVLVGWIAGPLAVVMYSCTAKIITVALHQGHTFVHLAIPAYSEMRGNSSREELMTASTNLGLLTLLLSGGMAGVLLMTNGPFVTWWVGDEFFGGKMFTVLLVAAMICRHMMVCLTSILFCFGFEKVSALVALVHGLLLVVAAWILGASMGPIGVALGALLVYAVSLPLACLGIHKNTELPITRLLGSYWPWFWRFSVLIGVLAVVNKFWTPEGVVQIVFTGAAVFLLYILVLFPVVVSSPLWTKAKQQFSFLERISS